MRSCWEKIMRWERAKYKVLRNLNCPLLGRLNLSLWPSGRPENFCSQTERRMVGKWCSDQLQDAKDLSLPQTWVNEYVWMNRFLDLRLAPPHWQEVVISKPTRPCMSRPVPLRTLGINLCGLWLIPPCLEEGNGFQMNSTKETIWGERARARMHTHTHESFLTHLTHQVLLETWANFESLYPTLLLFEVESRAWEQFASLSKSASQSSHHFALKLVLSRMRNLH